MIPEKDENGLQAEEEGHGHDYHNSDDYDYRNEPRSENGATHQGGQGPQRLRRYQVRGSIRLNPGPCRIVYIFMDQGRTSDLWSISANGGEPTQVSRHRCPGLG